MCSLTGSWRQKRGSFWWFSWGSITAIQHKEISGSPHILIVFLVWPTHLQLILMEINNYCRGPITALFSLVYTAILLYIDQLVIYISIYFHCFFSKNSKKLAEDIWFCLSVLCIRASRLVYNLFCSSRSFSSWYILMLAYFTKVPLRSVCTLS
jgi:hypothetical protein